MKQLSKARRILLYAGPFPALAFFKIWAASNGSGPGSGSLTVVAFFMLAFCAIVIVAAKRWDKPSCFDWTIGGYFALIWLSLLVWPDAAGRVLARFSVTGIYGCLFAAAFFPPFFGMAPFTCHYAKKYAPEAVWNNPVFLRVNRIMTYAWAGIFAFSALLSLYPSVITRAIIPLGIILCVGVPFNLLFPDFYLKRLGLPSLKALKETAVIKMKDRVAGEAFSSQAGNAGTENALPSISPKSDVTESTHTTPGQKRKENTMRVLALNSSARSRGESKTELMLNHLVNGMREAGADVEIVNLREKNIANCVGCFTCMTKTPGKCVLKDDMTRDLFPRWLESDLVIYATPLFHHTVNATMKTFIERTWPICEPFLLENGGRWVHPLRRKHPGVVVLSVCGFPAMSAFGGLTHYVKFLYEAKGKGTLWAEIYRPGAEFMVHRKDKQKDILDATIQAGRELVVTHGVSPETLALIEQPLTDNVSDFAKIANCSWKTCISEGVTLRKFADEGMIPRPDSVETFMMIFSLGFNPAGAGDTRAVLQFNFSGDVRGTCHFRIENGSITTSQGPAESPDLTIDTPFDVWMDITTGKADGQEMFMAQKYKVQGDPSLLMKMGRIFGNKG